jgi:cold shock CspA family protein
MSQNTGVIRKLRDGYGFIAGNDGIDYFLHWTAMQKGTKTFRELVIGDRVEFGIYAPPANAPQPKGPRAIECKVTG